MPRLLALMAAIALAGSTGKAADELERDFNNPPPAARPMVWWHWMGRNISREGITKDLEAMKAAGIGGATIFNLTSGVQAGAMPLKNPLFPQNDYRGPAWWELVKHAAAEAERLGLNLGMNNCPGYSATGGPWITPEKSMKMVVWSVAVLAGGQKVEGVLAQPKTNLGFYRDIAVLALPDVPEVPLKEVLDLSAQMTVDGAFKWDVPAGKWLLYRFGYTSTQASPHPIPEEIKAALECDKLSAADSRFHFQQVLQPIQEHLGPLLGKGLRHLTMDSYEGGMLNWTEGFRDEFTRRRGYDPVPWLPTLDKKTIGGADPSSRFAWDFKTTISDLFVQNHFRQGRALMNALGVKMVHEPYWGPFSTTEAAAVPDMTMGEFMNPGHGNVSHIVVGPAQAAGMRVIGAEAFTAYPEKSIWCETPGGMKKTGDSAWASGVNLFFMHYWVHQPFPDNLKPGMTMGWWGTHLGRHQTWYEPGKAWIAYLARSQSLLQRGEAVSDFLALDSGYLPSMKYFHPKTKFVSGEPFSDTLASYPAAGSPAYRADAIAASDFIAGAAVKGGRIVLPSGRTYAFLQLPKTPLMLPATARKLRELANAGAVIVGPRPERSPSLQDYPKADEEVAAIGRELWGAPNTPEHPVGKGRVFTDQKAAVTAMKLAPDLDLKSSEVQSCHRRDGDTDIYFVANVGQNEIRNTATLRVSGKLPELWDSEHGTHAPARSWRIKDGLTQVDLVLPPLTSLFIVLRQPTSATASLPLPSVSAAMAPVEVSGEWAVTFGAGRQVAFPALSSWTQSADREIKYFSGTATYRKAFAVPAEMLKPDANYCLDLGTVKELARVRINGVNCGVAWHMPYRVAIPRGALKGGENTLEIEITNTWANRLIGDEYEADDCSYRKPVDAVTAKKDKDGKPVSVGRMLSALPDWLIQGQPRPSKRRTFCTWNYFTQDSPLLESGLLGPVRIVIKE